ncbi:hypothetical protein RFI_05126 [Reticulomyxa filosa]|uniref:Uncharacterized protein n=1 Tax=Reticulomyxa filosa TaxID=46433 RepID=X6P0A5_RETFI|nr:hypothetical protein RFI_05126 [Reticulomyxa filosa]|eukprot:ETO31990.1 hypothetical protein RFI_05126 [Reticulomyxa filosa]
MSFGQSHIPKNVAGNQFNSVVDSTPCHTRTHQPRQNSSFFLSTMTPWTANPFRRRRVENTPSISQVQSGETSFTSVGKSLIFWVFSMLSLIGSLYFVAKMLISLWWGWSQQWNWPLLLQKMGLIDPQMLKDNHRLFETHGTKFVEDRYNAMETNGMMQTHSVHNNGISSNNCLHITPLATHKLFLSDKV